MLKNGRGLYDTFGQSGPWHVNDQWTVCALSRRTCRCAAVKNHSGLSAILVSECLWRSGWFGDGAHTHLTLLRYSDVCLCAAAKRIILFFYFFIPGVTAEEQQDEIQSK